MAAPENAEKVVENFHTHQIWDSNIKGIAVWTTDAPKTVGGEEVVADKKTFIRKTSLDEFPQFINVLKGDMSLVVTRPPTMDEFEHYTPSQKSRLSMRPGITGIWQVSDRSDIRDFDEVVKLDMLYIDNWSLGWL